MTIDKLKYFLLICALELFFPLLILWSTIYLYDTNTTIVVLLLCLLLEKPCERIKTEMKEYRE
jgi:hypothetical protein